MATERIDSLFDMGKIRQESKEVEKMLRRLIRLSRRINKPSIVKRFFSSIKRFLCF